MKGSSPYEDVERQPFIRLSKVEDTDRKGGNRSHRNVNNNNHNNSLLFSQRLFGAAFSSVREWAERVEPHPLRVPFFLPPPVSTIAARFSTLSTPSVPSNPLSPFPRKEHPLETRGTDCALFADLGSHV